MPNQIIISNRSIQLDHEARVSLNELHQLSGSGDAKRPSQWLRLKSTQELINELDTSNCVDLHSLPITQTEGRNGGTYAHELLAISYAGWISPKFQLQVNQAFLNSHCQPLIPEVPSHQMVIDKDKYIELLERQIAHLESQPRGKALSPTEKQRIHQLRDKGYNIIDIVRLTGRSEYAVRDVLKGDASC